MVGRRAHTLVGASPRARIRLAKARTSACHQFCGVADVSVATASSVAGHILSWVRSSIRIRIRLRTHAFYAGWLQASTVVRQRTSGAAA